MSINPYVAADAEQAMLTLMFVRASECEQYFGELQEDDFAIREHRRLFRAMIAMHAAKKPIDLVTVIAEYPELDNQTTVMIGSGYGILAHADQYVKLLKEAAARRRLYSECKAAMDALSADDPVEGVAERLRVGLGGFMTGSIDEQTSVRSALVNGFDRLITPRSDGVTMNLPALDALTRGFYPERLYVVGARPSVGKTVFGMAAALQAAMAGKRVLFVNREMHKDDLMRRMIAHITGIPIAAMENGKLSEAQTAQYVEVFGALSRADIHITNFARSVEEIRGLAVRLSAEKPVGMIVVDYLQRLHAPHGARKGTSRDEVVGHMTWGLKDISMDLHVPVVLLSQLNRSASNTRPHMGTLRESGNIEQDADVVILLHAPDAEDVPASRAGDYRKCVTYGGRYLEMIVDKNRHGPTGIAPVMFIGETVRYVAI